MFRQACDRDYGASCFGLARMHTNGLGVPQNDSIAAFLHGKACGLGEPEGCFSLGTMYSYGIGVRRDPALADSLLRQACDGGYAPAGR